jgi:hypothetical protein
MKYLWMFISNTIKALLVFIIILLALPKAYMIVECGVSAQSLKTFGTCVKLNYNEKRINDTNDHVNQPIGHSRR